MRLSAINGDPGFAAWTDTIRLRGFPVVTVDGVRVENCLTADEELGEAHCYVTPLTIVEDALLTEVKRGKVRIEFNGNN